jgi:adenine phosphoribosyltransferase
VSAGFVPIRKKGKLPYTTVRIAYSLEYGLDEMEMHADAVAPGERVVLVDDLIATGGTLLAAAKLFAELGGVVAGVAAIVDLVELGGTRRLREAGLPVHTLCEFRENE